MSGSLSGRPRKCSDISAGYRQRCRRLILMAKRASRKPLATMSAFAASRGSSPEAAIARSAALKKSADRSKIRKYQPFQLFNRISRPLGNCFLGPFGTSNPRPKSKTRRRLKPEVDSESRWMETAPGYPLSRETGYRAELSRAAGSVRRTRRSKFRRCEPPWITPADAEEKRETTGRAEAVRAALPNAGVRNTGHIGHQRTRASG